MNYKGRISSLSNEFMVMFAAALWVKTGSVSDPSTCFNNTHYLSFTLWWAGSFGFRPWRQNMNILVQHMMCFSVLKSQAVSYISMLLKTEHKVTLFLHATGLECNRIPSYHWQDWNPIYHFPLYGTFLCQNWILPQGKSHSEAWGVTFMLHCAFT